MAIGDQAATSSRTRNTPGRRAAIVTAVKTPLGFFALVVLAVEGILAVTVSVTDGFDRRMVVIGMIVLIVSLVAVVTGLATWRPDALYGKRPAVAVDVRERRGGKPIDGQKPMGAAPVEVIKKPRFLLAAAPGGSWADLLYSDERIIEKAVPRARICRTIDATSIVLSRELVHRDTYDVVQILGDVDRRGDIKLGDTRLSAEGFSRLIGQADIKLVVLASCDSATLAAGVASRSNMVAATGSLNVDAWAQWSMIFYSLLGKGAPLSQSFSIAQSVINLPVAMILHRDIEFGR